VRELLGRDGVLERMGDDCIHEAVAQAVEAQLAATGRPPPSEPGAASPPPSRGATRPNETLT
jgi:hypothetical protein